MSDELENQDEGFLGSIGNVAGGLLGEGEEELEDDLEDEFEDEGEFEGEDELEGE